MSPMTPYGSFDNQGNADVLAMSASAAQGEQVGMKKAGHRPSGHALPFECQIVVLGGAQRRLVARFVEPRNMRAPPPAHGTEGG